MELQYKLKTFLDECEISFLKHPVFLPELIPAKSLCAPFEEYVEILDSLHLYNHPVKGGTRVFMEECLKDIPVSRELIFSLPPVQQETLFNVLSMLCHCYRWDFLPATDDTYAIRSLVFPENLWTPFCWLADHYDVPRCGTLYTTTISNFNLKNQLPGTAYDFKNVLFDDLRINHNWLPEEHSKELETWIKIFVMTEMLGGYVNIACINILKCILNRDVFQLKENLHLLSEGILRISKVFNSHVRSMVLNTNVWRQVVQPTFIWGLSTGKNSDIPLEGASGLQVACLQLIDTVLGIDMNSKMGKALLNSRQYFPKKFRRVFDRVEPLRSALCDYLNEVCDKEATDLYNKCLEHLESYRKSHLQRGKLYIKGDGTSKQITTTGLTMNASEIAVEEFEADMQERINEMIKKYKH